MGILLVGGAARQKIWGSRAFIKNSSPPPSFGREERYYLLLCYNSEINSFAIRQCLADSQSRSSIPIPILLNASECGSEPFAQTQLNKTHH